MLLILLFVNRVWWVVAQIAAVVVGSALWMPHEGRKGRCNSGEQKAISSVEDVVMVL
jgi:hypothetical protein